MEIQRESDMRRIKQKMTEIRRTGKRPVINNYYLNCEQDDDIFAIFGNETVVFWDDDRGVIRAYFYSVCANELIELLKKIPDGTIIDYLTHNEGEYQELFQAAGLRLSYEMMRMVTKIPDPEKQAELAKRERLFMQTLYMKDNVRIATEKDCDVVYQKLYEVFDSRESHLCTKKQLLQYIQNGWVVIYLEEESLKGFYIFTVKANQFYGYQIWNGTGPEGYFSMTQLANHSFAEYIKKTTTENEMETTSKSKTPKPGFCWVNRKNKKNLRLLKFQNSEFDGLYDFVYEK